MTDAEIVQLYWDRNESAVMETEKKYGHYCSAIAKNILGNKEDVEECVNDTYLKAWKSIPPHRPKVLSAYLGKITRNLAFNRYKFNHAEKRGGGELSEVLDELSDCVSGNKGVEQELENKELMKAINGFLASLPPEKRNIFVCRYWYSDSVSEIARQYGMRENTVSMTLKRLRNKLQKYLEERGFEL